MIHSFNTSNIEFIKYNNRQIEFDKLLERDANKYNPTPITVELFFTFIYLFAIFISKHLFV